MIALDVVPGVHQVSHASTNCYLVEDDGGAVLVDAGLPGTIPLLDVLLARRGRRWSDLAAVVLTHGHFDHLGAARHAERHGVPVHVHRRDEHIARHPYRYRPGRPRLLYPLTRPGSLPHLTAMVRAGALQVPGVESPVLFDDDAGRLDLPGGLVVVPTPGHTDGHVAFHLPERDAVLTGDALVTLDPYTGRRGPRVVARAGTRDAHRALVSLASIATTGSASVLPGHGAPYHAGADLASLHAVRAGIA